MLHWSEILLISSNIQYSLILARIEDALRVLLVGLKNILIHRGLSLVVRRLLFLFRCSCSGVVVVLSRSQVISSGSALHAVLLIEAHFVVRAASLRLPRILVEELKVWLLLVKAVKDLA